MTRVARIALAFPFPLEPGHRGKDALLIRKGLQELGFEVGFTAPTPWGRVEACRRSGPAARTGRPCVLGRAAARRGRRLHVPEPQLGRSRIDGGRRPRLGKADTTGSVVARHAPGATLTYAFHDPAGPVARAPSVAAGCG